MFGADNESKKRKDRPKKIWKEEVNGILLAREIKDSEWEDSKNAERKHFLNFGAQKYVYTY